MFTRCWLDTQVHRVKGAVGGGGVETRQGTDDKQQTACDPCYWKLCRSGTVRKRRMCPQSTKRNWGCSLDVVEFDLKDLFVCNSRELEGREFKERVQRPPPTPTPPCLGEMMHSS